MAGQSLLEQLLLKNHQFKPDYSKDFANHLPMALVALKGIGAMDSDLDNFFNHYCKRLIRFSEEELDDPEQNSPFLTLVKNYQGLLKDFSRNSILKNKLPQIIDGIASSGFHGIIRLYYALNSPDEEFCHALAYLDYTFESLYTDIQNSVETKPLSDILLELYDYAQNNSIKIVGSSIDDHLRVVAADKGYRSIICSTQPAINGIQDIATVVLKIYFSDPCFTNLHLVTGTHALRHLLPYFEDRISVLCSFCRAISTAYVVVNTPKIQEIWIDGVISWEEIKAKTVKSKDDHDIKFIYTLFDESQFYNDLSYQKIASSYIRNKGL